MYKTICRSPTPALKWLGAGAFHRTEWDHNGRAHYERRLTQEEARLAVVRVYVCMGICV